MNGQLLTICDEYAEVQIAPQWGAALTRYDYDDLTAGARHSILRPWDGHFDNAHSVFSLASNVLVPWCNRIGSSGFEYDHVFYPMGPNLDGEKFPIHGDGFLAAWEVTHRDASSAELHLQSRSCAPYAYEARLQYSLRQGALQMALSVQNQAEFALPYGIGFHPWFVRSTGDFLQFESSHYWTEDGEYLPLERRPCVTGDGVHFNSPHALPEKWINTAFEGWDRKAILSMPNAGLEVHIRTSETLGNLMVYSPGGAADFVCLEPMSHVPNAHCLPDLSAGARLTGLEPGACLQGAVWIHPGPTKLP